jgi:putative transposase
METSMKRKSYSPQEIASKLQLADKLAAEGKVQSEIVKALGVSVMTYHRWRKARRAQTAAAEGQQLPARGATAQVSRIKDLELENARLRQLVTDFLLDKIKLQESLEACDKDVQRPR